MESKRNEGARIATMFFIEPGTAFDIAGALFERRNKIRQAALRALNYMRRGHIKVMAFGTGGTGKTTLGELFSQGFAATGKPKVYDRSVAIERFAMPGELVCTLFAAPGQERYREDEVLVEGSSWANLYREIAKGQSVGIINVVSYGYHSIRTLEIEETDLFKPGMTAEEFLPLYLETRVCFRVAGAG